MNKITSNIGLSTLLLFFSGLGIACKQEINFEGAWVASRSPEYQEVYLSTNSGISMIEGVGFRSFKFKIDQNQMLVSIWNEYSADSSLFIIDIYNNDLIMLYAKDIISNDTIELHRIPSHDTFSEKVDLDSLYSEYLLRRERYLNSRNSK